MYIRKLKSCNGNIQIQVVEKAHLRKSDLKARSIFHTVREKIEDHIAIVLTGLAIARYVVYPTGKSIQKVLYS